MKILITGAKGSIGQALDLPNALKTDIDEFDVTEKADAASKILTYRPDVVLHLAAVKDAPAGEETPEECVRVNASGTANVLWAASQIGAKVVTASTCKAAEPETCYGASKLLAERMTMNQGGVVVRFYNVIESSGNVFRLWESIPESEPIPYTPCHRYFITRDQAVNLLKRSISLPTGRYAVNPGPPRSMFQVASELYPDRELVQIDARRGDRIVEPLCGRHERTSEYEGLLEITSPHD